MIESSMCGLRFHYKRHALSSGKLITLTHNINWLWNSILLTRIGGNVSLNF